MTKIKKAVSLVGQLKGERTKREARWREISKWICPWRGCLDGDGQRDFYEEDSTLTLFTGVASQAILRGASGMTSGMTPRNTPWFKPDFQDKSLAEASGARDWLDMINIRMNDCLSAGGFYQAIQCFNMDLLWAGCALLYSEKSPKTTLRYESVQVGSFWVATDAAGELETVARLTLIPVQTLADKFGEAKLSKGARALLNKDPYKNLRVWHLCRKAKSGRWPVTSQWWEEDGEDFLRDSGFHEMPYFFTCWNSGSTVYGTGPGDQSIADARQMDILERRKLAGLGKLVDPPVTAPTQLKDVLDLSPGGINFMPTHEEIKSILDLGPYAQSLQYLQAEIQVVQKRLTDSLMASIFASVPLDQRPRDMSATEFLERKRETLQQLGPVISAYEPNVLTPVLARTLQSLDRAGKIPPAPEALAELELLMKVEFISPMANALRQSGAEAARSILMDAAEMFKASQIPEIWDKIDMDQAIDELARAVGAPGGMIRSDEDVEALRAKRQEAQARQEQADQTMRQLEMGKVASGIQKDQIDAAVASKENPEADPSNMGAIEEMKALFDQ